MTRVQATQHVQIGVETTPQTPVPANHEIPGLQLVWGAKTDSKEFKANAHRHARLVRVNKQWTEGKLEGALPYGSLQYILSGLWGAATTSTVGTSSTQNVWTPPLTGPFGGKTYTMQYGDSSFCEQAPGCFFNGVTITSNRDDVKVSAPFYGGVLDTTQTLTATPTQLPLTPAVGADASLYIDNTSAGLGTTLIANNITMEFAYVGPYEAFWAQNKSLPSYATMVDKRDFKPTVKIRLPYDAVGRGLLADLRAGTQKYLRLIWTGPQIESGVNASLTLDLSTQAMDPADTVIDKEIVVTDYTFLIEEDTVWGKALVATLINSAAATL